MTNLTPEIKELLIKHSEDIKNNNFNSLYEDCPTSLKNKLTSLLYSIGVYPLHFLTSIPSYFCSNCEYPGNNNLLIVPNTIRNIGVKAFNECQGLKKVILNGFGRIGIQSFANCQDLEEVTINKNFRVLGESAFENCTNLKNVVLPSSIVFIEEFVFNNCNSLYNIRYNSTMEDWEQIEILNRNEGLKSLKIQCTNGVLQFDGKYWIQ